LPHINNQFFGIKYIVKDKENVPILTIGLNIGQIEFVLLIE